jgi:hypothetical protein
MYPDSVSFEFGMMVVLVILHLWLIWGFIKNWSGAYAIVVSGAIVSAVHFSNNLMSYPPSIGNIIGIAISLYFLLTALYIHTKLFPDCIGFDVRRDKDRNYAFSS